MDEIDRAIAEVEANKAEKEAKKNQKKRARNASGKGANEIEVSPKMVEASSGKEKSIPPPKKKQKLPKKSQQNPYRAVYGNDAHPTFKLTLHNMKGGNGSVLGMKDIRALMVATIAKGPAIVWADIRLSSLIKHVALIILDSLSYDLFLDASSRGLMPYLTSSFQHTISKAPGNATRVFDGSSILLRHTMSRALMKNLKKEQKAENEAAVSVSNTPPLPSNNMDISLPSPKSADTQSNAENTSICINISAESANNTSENPKEDAQKVPNHLMGPAKKSEELTARFPLSKQLSDKSVFYEVAKLSPGHCLLSFRELETNLYPLPHTVTEPGFVDVAELTFTTPSSREQPNGNTIHQPQSDNDEFHKEQAQYHLLAVDCEMCRTRTGVELTRVVVVNTSLEVVYDAYVKPKLPVVDYLTRYSGITKEDLDPVTITLEQVQRDLIQLFSPRTILIGHSLENDLKALKILHYRVVDTALLYPHSRGETFKNSLKFLAENWLQEAIQLNNHDPTQDAITAMKLALLKFRRGSTFGLVPIGDGEENMCEYLSRLGLRTAVIDSVHNCKVYSGSHSDLYGEEADSEVVKKATKAFGSCHYEFASARLRALEKYYVSIDNTFFNANGKNEVNPVAESDKAKEDGSVASSETTIVPIDSLPQAERTTELELCKEMDEQVKLMVNSLPKRSLVIVTGGHGNLARVRTLANIKKKTQICGKPWTELDDTKTRAVFEKARETVSFFQITSEAAPTVNVLETSHDHMNEAP